MNHLDGAWLMFQARLEASSPLDARLHDLLWSQEPAAIAAVLPLLPEDTGRLLVMVITVAEAERPVLWVTIALQLDQLGMKLSPWVAFRQALDLLPMAADRAVICRMRAEWLARIGQVEQAEAESRLACRLERKRPQGRVIELADSVGSVICAQSSPEEFRQLMQDLQSPLWCDPLRDPSLTKAGFLAVDVPEYGLPLDLSFLIVDAVGRPLVQVECDVLQDNHLGCRSSAIEIVVLMEEGERAVPLALRQLAYLARWSAVDEITLQLWDDQPREALHQWVTGFPHIARRMRRATIDLANDPGHILADFRQSNRSLARWGQRELEFASSWEGDGTGAELINTYWSMVESSGRRSTEGERFSDHVHRGEFALYGCRDAHGWLAMVMVSFHGDVANYGGSARAPEQAKSALPALMHHVAVDVKRRGFRQFCLGDLHDDPSFSAKLRSIAAFKAGLTRTFRSGQWCDVAVGWPHRSARLGG